MAKIFSPKQSTPKRVLFQFKKHLRVTGTLITSSKTPTGKNDKGAK